MSSVECGLTSLDLFHSRLLETPRFERYYTEICPDRFVSPLSYSDSTPSTTSAAVTPLLLSSRTIDTAVLRGSPALSPQKLVGWDFTSRNWSMTPADLLHDDDHVKKRSSSTEPQPRYAPLIKSESEYIQSDVKFANNPEYFPTTFDTASQARQQSYPGHYTEAHFSTTARTPLYSPQGEVHPPKILGSSCATTALPPIPTANQSPTGYHYWSRDTPSGAPAYPYPGYAPAISPSNTFEPSHIRPGEYVLPSQRFPLSKPDQRAELPPLESSSRSDDSPSYLSPLPSIVANITAQQRRQHQLDKEFSDGRHSPQRHDLPSLGGASSQGYGQDDDSSREKNRCYDHGCNGKAFSTFSNLLRHQREKEGISLKATCPRCGAEFTRSTARNSHMRHGKCKEICDLEVAETSDA